MIIKKILLGMSALILILSVNIAQSAVINASDTGFYNNSGIHNPFNANYIVGDSSGIHYRNWFTFDLSSFGTIASATLRAYLIEPQINTSYFGGSSETWTLWDVTTSIASLTGGGSGLVATFNDLGGGVSYGSVNVTATDMGGFVEVTLNSAALTALSSASGLWAIGGSVTTLVGNDEYIFAFSRNDPPVELVVNEATIPEPATLALMGLGLAAGIGYQRRRSKKAV